MRPARADWGGGHFRTALERHKRFPNTQSCMGHFDKDSIDRYLVRDHELPRSWPSESVEIPEYPMEHEKPSPLDNKFPWLPFERDSAEEYRFSRCLDRLNRQHLGGMGSRTGRRRSTMRISKGDMDDNTDYEALNAATTTVSKKKTHRFGDPEMNKLRDADSLHRMESWLRCEKLENSKTPHGDAFDLRMGRWIEGHIGRVKEAEEKQKKSDEAKRSKYRRASHYGNIMDKDEAGFMSSAAGPTLSMTSDATALPSALKTEKRRTMAYVKT